MKNLILFVCIAMVFLACQPSARQKTETDWTVYRKAYAFFNHQNDSAFYYFNKVAVSLKDSAQSAMAFNFMAIIQTDAGDHYGAQESLTASLKYLNEHRKSDQATLLSAYNELGMTSTNLKNYPQAISYFNQAYRFVQDTTWKTTVLNNKALAYQKNQEYAKAISLYLQLLPKTKGLDYARILNNLARTAWLDDPRYQAASELRNALQIRQKENDQWGLNASYLSLAAYYEKQKPDSALSFARKRFAVARELKSPDDQLEALTTLIRISPSGDAQRYFSTYQRLNDSLQTARNAAKNQFALIRYNVEKSNADNLRLQKDVTEKRYQLFSAVLLFVAIASGLSYYYRKRRRRLQFENQLAIRDNEMRVAKKVHDGVANGIYQLMSEVEHGLVTDNEELADKLDFLYQRSRDISYDRPSIANSAFGQQLSVQLLAFGGPNCHISLSGNNDTFWSSTGDSVKENLSYVLQELLVNMKKHSRAANVVVKFESDIKNLLIGYSDDGIGWASDNKFGAGLSGTENRIQAIGGTITFEGEPGKGLKILISIPKNRL